MMFASEVLRQLEEDPDLDLNALPAGLAELYMDRYQRPFGRGKDGQVAFRLYTAPMLGVLLAAREALPTEMVRRTAEAAWW